jgi:uncharacterized membrane protein YhaH (DUF805 family)
MNNIARGFGRIWDFSGRDRRDQFWPYLLVVFGLMFVGVGAVFLPTFGETMGRMTQFVAEHPDQGRVMTGPGSYSVTVKGSHPELFPDLAPVMLRMGAVMAVAVLLLAAAVTRRLHDRGLTGFLGLLPLPFISFAVVEMPKMFAAVGDAQTMPPMFLPIFFNNLLYLASLGLLGFLMWGPSQPRTNRYGEMPPQPPPPPPPPPLGPRRR